MKYKVLVNKNNKIKDNYLNKINLIPTKDIEDKEIFVEEQTLNAYKELRNYLLEKNIQIELCSVYRSIERQQD